MGMHKYKSLAWERKQGGLHLEQGAILQASSFKIDLWAVWSPRSQHLTGISLELNMAGMHEITFSWPEVDANAVIVTGTFDQWSCSVHLTKTSHGFEGKVKVPWGERILYKFVVDGRWVTARWKPEESDGSGNINNVYECPPAPELLVAQGISPSNIHPESESKHEELEDSPSTRPVPSTDQDHLSERLPPAAQDPTLESTTSALIQANPNTVLGAAEKFVSNSAGTAEQAKEKMHRKFLDTAQVPEAAVFMADQDQAMVSSLAEPGTQTHHDIAIREPLTQTKERETVIREAVQTNKIDLSEQEKIPTTTPERTYDAHGSTSQQFVGPESQAESALAVNIFSATPVPDAVETSEMGLDARVDQDVQSEAAVTDYLAVHNTSHKELDVSSSTSVCFKEPSENTKTIETEANTSAPLTSTGASTEALLLAKVRPQLEGETNKMPFFTVEGARTDAFAPMHEANSIQLTDNLDARIAGAGPVPTQTKRIDHVIPPAGGPSTEVSPSARVPTVDVPGTIVTPDVPSEASPVNTTSVTAASTGAGTNFTQTASVSEKSRNGNTNSSMQPASSSRDTEPSSNTSDHAASKSGSVRKKRKSFFGKVMQLFSSEKGKEKR